MDLVMLYFAGFGLGLLPALAFFILCGMYGVISDISCDIAP